MNYLNNSLEAIGVGAEARIGAEARAGTGAGHRVGL